MSAKAYKIIDTLIAYIDTMKTANKDIKGATDAASTTANNN